MTHPATRYVRGMFNREKLTASQARALDAALAKLEQLAADGAITFAVVEDPNAVSHGGRQRRKGAKPFGDRSIGPTERRVHAYLSAQMVATALKLPVASTRAHIFHLKNRGLVVRSNQCEKIAEYAVTTTPMPPAGETAQ